MSATTNRSCILGTERLVVSPTRLEALSDAELERELTLAALTERRRGRFDLLLAERRRRRASQMGRGRIARVDPQQREAVRDVRAASDRNLRGRGARGLGIERQHRRQQRSSR
jgi:hypothetical protein